jgi:hypothetical protein
MRFVVFGQLMFTFLCLESVGRAAGCYQAGFTHFGRWFRIRLLDGMLREDVKLIL